VICQVLRENEMEPFLSSTCLELHVAGQGLRPHEITPAVHRAFRLIPNEIMAAWAAGENQS
jgi:hypothetical protein